MKVELISYSKAADAFNAIATNNSIGDLVAYSARVSNPSNQMNTATNGKLLAYLLKHKNFSPFEMVSMCLDRNNQRHSTTDAAPQVVLIPRVQSAIRQPC